MPRSLRGVSPQRRIALVSVGAAIVLIGIKVAAGLASGSLGLLSEAAHSGTDLVAALLTFFAVGVSGRPADRGHPYGHGKAEHLSALGEAVILMALSVAIAATASARLAGAGDHEVDAAWYVFAVIGSVIVIDASRSRVYVYENDRGQPRLVADYYSTLGKQGIGKLREGDQKTPLGVYHVTAQIPGSKLPDLYGWGAFPINYPNDWDRRLGKTGYGIWLHGVPSENYVRAPRASDGCIALANDEIADLAKRVHPGATPVVIAERVEWVTPEAWRAEREGFLRQLEAWRRRAQARYGIHTGLYPPVMTRPPSRPSAQRHQTSGGSLGLT